MQKSTFKNNQYKRKAFTLIELLIVIAIIGILFIVLISKVDFATDKAKATGVQTDFRSFQMAFETVSRENAGFNTFGWDTGDANQNGKRDSYDEGDDGAGGGIAKNGIQDGSEVFTGRKVYDETFTKIFSLKKNGTGSYDRDALNRLETAINANLDPKLHITIKDDGEIVMANGAKDPWNKEYHGYYISNAETDGKDRGAIVMYSDGANGEFGSEHSISNGIVKVIVPGSNKDGKDDYSMSVIYTYTNGYGEVKTITSGFSNNQTMLGGNGNNVGGFPSQPDMPIEPDNPTNDIEVLDGGLYETGTNNLLLSWEELIEKKIIFISNGNTLFIDIDQKLALDGDFHINSTITRFSGSNMFNGCENLTGIFIPASLTSLSNGDFRGCTNLKTVVFDSESVLTTISSEAFKNCQSLERVVLPPNLQTIQSYAFYGCTSLKQVEIPNSVKSIGTSAFAQCSSLVSFKLPSLCTVVPSFAYCTNLQTIILHDNIKSFDMQTFANCTSLKSIDIPDGITELPFAFIRGCTALETIDFPTSLTKIGDDALKDCNFETLVIPNTINSIGQYSLAVEVKNLYLPSSITEAGVRALGINVIDNIYFNGTINQYIDFLSLNQSIYDPAVSTGQINLYVSNNGQYELVENLIIDDTITTIPRYCFKGNKSLKSVYISDSVEFIGSAAFAYCPNLTTVRLPDNASYESYVFSGSHNISVIECGPNGIVLNDASALRIQPSNRIKLYFRGSISQYLTNNTFTTYILFDEIYIYDSDNEFELVTEVIVPDDVTIIKENLFRDYSLLEKVVLHENVQKIEAGAFMNYAFDLICYAIEPPILSADAISHYPNMKIYVPEESVELYKNASEWSTFNIYAIP